MPSAASELPDLHERLERLAEGAPQRVSGDDLWDRGRAHGRQRSRRRGALGLACLLLLAFVGGSALLLSRPPGVSPAAPPDGEVSLPDELRAPGSWARTRTLEDGPPGRLVAIVGAERSTLTTSEMVVYGVSAATGEYVWLDLPGLDDAARVELSPDGTHVAYWLDRPEPDRDLTPTWEVVDGYAVLDTATGEVSLHRVDSALGLEVAGVAWTPGAAWLQFAAFTELDSDSSSSTLQPTQVVDLSGGGVTQLPVGTAPSLVGQASTTEGFVASVGKGRRAWVTGPRPAEWERFRGTTPLQGEPVPSPDGSLLAGIAESEDVTCCGRGAVRVGVREGDRVRWRTVPDAEYTQVVGWRSPTEVLAVDDDGTVHAVDVRTGAARPVTRLAGTSFRQQPALATSLLDAPVVPAVAPSSGIDQRAALGTATLLVLVGGLVGAWALVRRRRGRP